MQRLKSTWNTMQYLISHEANVEQQFGPVRRFVGWQILKRAHKRPITINAFETGRLHCHPNDSASNAVIYCGWPDWAEMHLLRQLLRPNDTFLDIGANVGVYSVLASTLVGPQGQILAFEPDPANAARLRENFVLNGLNIDNVHQSALGEERCVLRFENNSGSTGGVIRGETTEGIEVPCERLDNIVSKEVKTCIAKVDVEGFELEVMKGASSLLAAHILHLEGDDSRDQSLLRALRT